MRNVKTIEDNVFSGSGIKKGIIGNNVTTIGTGIFSGCKSMTDAYIGDSIQPKIRSNLILF
jgi:hypothetical protein